MVLQKAQYEKIFRKEVEKVKSNIASARITEVDRMDEVFNELIGTVGNGTEVLQQKNQSPSDKFDDFVESDREFADKENISNIFAYREQQQQQGISTQNNRSSSSDLHKFKRNQSQKRIAAQNV